MTDGCLGLLATLQHLSRLAVHKNSNITDAGVKLLTEKSPKLEDVLFSDCGQLTFRCVEKMHGLDRISLEHCPIEPEAIDVMASWPFSRPLKALLVPHLKPSPASVVELVRRCPQLEICNFASDSYRSITDAVKKEFGHDASQIIEKKDPNSLFG